MGGNPSARIADQDGSEFDLVGLLDIHSLRPS
jgi:hypothetical protein